MTDAITDRAIDVLILPADWTGAGGLHPVQQAALKRTLRSAFAYTPAGTVEGADLEIDFPRDPFETWVDKVLAMGGDELLVVIKGHTTIILPKPKKYTPALYGKGKGIYPKDYLNKERRSW